MTVSPEPLEQGWDPESGDSPLKPAIGSPSVGVDLHGRVAIVSGAGRGIGRSLALGLAEAGADLVIAARSTDQLESVAKEIRSFGRSVELVTGDLTDDELPPRVAAAAMERYGRLDLLVANAGTLGDTTADPTVLFRRVVEVNLIATYNLIEACLPGLKDGGGRILVIGSGAGHTPSRSIGYSSSKAAISMMVRVLAPILREEGVAINELVPGPVVTELAGPALVEIRAGLSPTVAATDWIKDPEDVVPISMFILGQPIDGPTGQRWSLCARDL